MPKNSILLHIGIGKTGSSFLQKTFDLNKQKLLQHDIYYASSIKRKYNKKYNLRADKSVINLINNIDTMSWEYNHQQTFISDEHLYKHLPVIPNFDRFLQTYSDRITLIIYTRNLFEHRFSSWGQIVKRSNCTTSFDEYLKSRPTHRPYPQILKWLELSRRYNIKIKLRNYSCHKTDLLETFMTDICGKLPDNLELPQLTKVNRSLSLIESELQRCLNGLKLTGSPLSDALCRECPSTKSQKPGCSREAYRLVVDSNLEVIQKINSFASSNEQIAIEDGEKLQNVYEATQNSRLTPKQIKIIRSYFKQYLNGSSPLKEVTED